LSNEHKILRLLTIPALENSPGEFSTMRGTANYSMSAG
jgi:hypothetical protein